jgi:hypothetical protein
MYKQGSSTFGFSYPVDCILKLALDGENTGLVQFEISDICHFRKYCFMLTTDWFPTKGTRFINPHPSPICFLKNIIFGIIKGRQPILITPLVSSHFWSRYCLSLYLWLLITPLVSSHFGHGIVCPYIYGF